MHQTWRFKRVNGTAYPDSIASSLRDASGAEVARLAEIFQRLRANLPLQGRRGPWEKEEATGSEGARLKSADKPFGISNGQFQI